VRLVSANNRDLREATAKGQFREELYYRVNVIAIQLPPLRERAGDVRLLVQAFLKRYGDGRINEVKAEAMATLERYRWPGNVRELQNVVERACALAEGEHITVRDLPDYVLGGEAALSASDPVTAAAMPDPRADLTLKDAKDRWMGVLEASYLRQILARHDGNISAAAKAAGIDRKTFHRLINKHSLK